MILGLMIVNSMGRANQQVVAQGVLEGWQYNGSHTSNRGRDFLPKGGLTREAIFSMGSSEDMVGNYTFEVDALVAVSAFGKAERSVKVATIILPI